MATLPDFYLLRTFLTSADLLAQLSCEHGRVRPCLLLRWVIGPDGSLAARWEADDAGAIPVPPD